MRQLTISDRAIADFDKPETVGTLPKMLLGALTDISYPTYEDSAGDPERIRLTNSVIYEYLVRFKPDDKQENTLRFLAELSLLLAQITEAQINSTSIEQVTEIYATPILKQVQSASAPNDILNKYYTALQAIAYVYGTLETDEELKARAVREFAAVSI